jgi:hypothetical protein
MVLFGHSQQKLNISALEDRHGVASLQTLNQSSLAFPSPFLGEVPGEVNNWLTSDLLLSLPSGKEEITPCGSHAWAFGPPVKYEKFAGAGLRARHSTGLRCVERTLD